MNAYCLVCRKKIESPKDMVFLKGPWVGDDGVHESAVWFCSWSHFYEWVEKFDPNDPFKPLENEDQTIQCYGFEDSNPFIL